MQATLDATGLKHLTRILTCATRFGDDLTFLASPGGLLLTATNSSMSAYCRFTLDKQFFSRYHVDEDPLRPLELENDVRVTGQLLVKSLLSVLKHRTVEKSVDRCELSIVDGAAPVQAPAGEQAANDQIQDEDSLESKLIVRLHCKHGVIKTHKLLLLNATILTPPSIPEEWIESRLTVTPRAVRDMLEHFPLAKGPKSDPQLVWSFAENEVYMKGMDSSLDAGIKGQLSTEATISAAEFEVYDIYEPTVTIAFHMREFLATVGFAESCSLTLDLRFTDPANPIFVDVDGDLTTALFVIATSQVAGFRSRALSAAPRATPHGVKRERGSDAPSERSASVVPTSARKVKPMKAAVRGDRASVVREMQGGSRASSMLGSMPPPSFPPPPAWRATPTASSRGSMPPPPAPRSSPPRSPPLGDIEPEPERAPEREPLFFPGSQLSLSQPLSQAAEAAIRESGLGIENMSAAEFLDMLEGEGEEVNIVPASQAEDIEMDVSMSLDEVPNASAGALALSGVVDDSDFNIYEDDEGDGEGTQLGPTQEDVTRSTSSLKAFRPLFDD